MATIKTAPATATRWNDLEAAFGPRAADRTWCWCRRFLDPISEVAGPADNREALKHEIATARVPPGLIGYVDGKPAGWTRVMPRDEVPGVVGNRALRRFLNEDPGVWWVTCFAVDRRHRSIGLATALLEAAVSHAGRFGATGVQGHPVDTDALKAKRVSGSALFTGTMRQFVAAGFTEIGRTYPSRPVMHREL
jgi:GNAT superfamily N-acetyltransferase